MQTSLNAPLTSTTLSWIYGRTFLIKVYSISFSHLLYMLNVIFFSLQIIVAQIPNFFRRFLNDI